MSESRTITLKQLPKYAKSHFKRKRPFMIWSGPGIGKSDTIAAITETYPNSLLVDIRLPLWEPTDIKGIPYYNANENAMVWAHPIELPSRELAAQYDTIVLFLDELNGAAPSVQMAAYQLILNRKVGTYELPDNVVVCAAGNRDGDKGVTFRMPKPLANRLLHYEIRVDFESWFDWAVNTNQHPDVVGFLAQNKQDLFKFDPNSADRSFQTPRSWSFVSEIAYDADEFNFSPVEATDMFAAAVGEGTAIKFVAHRKISGSLPSPEDILAGRVKNLKTEEVSALYSLAMSLCYEMKIRYDSIGKTFNGKEYDNKNFKEHTENLLTFIHEEFGPEMTIMTLRVLLTNYKVRLGGLKDTKAGAKLMADYADMIIDTTS